MIKGNNNYPRTVTITYGMLMSFELAGPRQHRTGCTGDRGNKNNSGSRGGLDHTLIHNTAPSGTVLSWVLMNAHHLT